MTELLEKKGHTSFRGSASAALYESQRDPGDLRSGGDDRKLIVRATEGCFMGAKARQVENGIELEIIGSFEILEFAEFLTAVAHGRWVYPEVE